ncbi:MAG: glycosyltransferase family 39 protein [Pseudomonadota bacterium]
MTAAPRWVWALALAILLSATVTSPGLFSIDELFYQLGAEAMARGALTIDNGYDAYASDNLRLFFLVAGPSGLVPQYPIGTALLGGALTPLLGDRALILSNALALALTLPVLHALARRLYGTPAIAGTAVLLFTFGSFAFEYAHGYWPHALSTFCVTLALLLTIRALDSPRGIPWAVLAGLMVGAGFLMRVDTVLILPAIGLVILIHGTMPLRLILAGAAGLMPGVAIAALANSQKFGTWNPISYGATEGGGIDVSTYPVGWLIPLFLGLLLILTRRSRFTPLVVRTLLALAAVLLALSLWWEASRDVWRAIAHGAHVLIVDLTQTRDARESVVRTPDGGVSFWGLSKKALGQSMPWIGALLALFATRLSAQARRGHLLILTAVVIWSLPFLWQAWHGGLGSNMRYFLPVIPLICIAGAYVWVEVLSGPRTPTRDIILGLAAGLLALGGWSQLSPLGLGGAQHDLAQIALIAMAVLALLSYTPLPVLRLQRLTFLACAALALIFGPILDTTNGQIRRALFAEANRNIIALESPVLAYGAPAIMRPILQREGDMIGVAGTIAGPIDVGLIRDVSGRGYAVYMPEGAAQDFLSETPGFALGTGRLDYGLGVVVEVVEAPQ